MISRDRCKRGRNRRFDWRPREWFALVQVPGPPRGVIAINPNAKHCEATERAAILPKQWPYSVIARSHHAPVLALAW